MGHPLPTSADADFICTWSPTGDRSIAEGGGCGKHDDECHPFSTLVCISMQNRDSRWVHLGHAMKLELNSTPQISGTRERTSSLEKIQRVLGGQMAAVRISIPSEIVGLAFYCPLSSMRRNYRCPILLKQYSNVHSANPIPLRSCWLCVLSCM